MGQHGCGTINDNAEQLIHLCGLTNFVIGGTLFAHNEIHKLTWISPNQIEKNQIDHLLTSGKWRRPIHEVHVRRRTDVGSDHHQARLRELHMLHRTVGYCILSNVWGQTRVCDVIFNIAIDWVTKKTMEGPTRGLRWPLFSSLEDRLR